MALCEIAGDVITGASTVAAAVIAVGGAVLVFYRQKEHELVQKRYLDEGIDVVIAAAEQALNIYSHNWARCTEILKSFRDLPTIKVEDLSSGFLPQIADRFSITAHYRLNVVVDSPVIWETFQLVLSFTQHASTVVTEEIPLALKVKLTTSSVSATKQEMVDSAMQVLMDLDKDSHRYHIVPGELHKISKLLEEQRFRFKAIRELRSHAVVKGVVEKLRTAFADKLRVDAA